MKKTKQHGGIRKGAGRPSGEPTKVIRIPEALEEQVQKMVYQHFCQQNKKA